MKKSVLLNVIIGLMLLSLSLPAMAHPGRTDANGGHYNRKTGEYHYHNGGSSKSSKSSSSSSSSPSIPKTVYASKITVFNMPSSIDIGETVNLNGSVYPSNAEDKTIFWESSDTSIATIDSSGKLEAIGVGSVVISAKTSRGTTSSFNLTIKEIVANDISIVNKTEKISINETLSMDVIFTPKNTTNKDVKWESADDSIISVDENGKLTALSLGKTSVTVRHKELSDSFEIEVEPILAESVEIRCINADSGEEYDELRFAEGKKIQLTAFVLPEFTTDATVKWSVSDAAVATIDQEGNLAMVSEGKVLVTAETTNGLSDEIEIEVYKESIIINIIAGIIVFLIFAVGLGGPIFLIIWIARKFKNKQ